MMDETELIRKLKEANRRLWAVANDAHKIMNAAHYDMMYGWQVGDVPLDEMVDSLSIAFNHCPHCGDNRKDKASFFFGGAAFCSEEHYKSFMDEQP
jgi:hypothetical protein